MTTRILTQRARLAPLIAALMLTAPVAAQQTAPTYPALSEVDPVEALSRYLRMLAANPRDLASLTGAGRAALAVGDANAALGFYARAEEIAPRNGRIKAGLAEALVQMEQPRTALKLFDEAVTLGVPVGEIAADRGLAHDLVGDNRSAQSDYTLALRSKDDDETLRRLALSMAISGDRAGALTMLDALLRRKDSGAVRARAFILALTGDQAGATKVVQAAMPGPQATVMSNFLSRLRTLNPAQKALAVNFGYFPSDGRAYTAAELFADARGARPSVPSSNPANALTPVGPPLGARPADANSMGRLPVELPLPADVPPPAHVLAAPIPGQTTLANRPAVTTGSPAPALTGTAVGSGPVASLGKMAAPVVNATGTVPTRAVQAATTGNGVAPTGLNGAAPLPSASASTASMVQPIATPAPPSHVGVAANPSSAFSNSVSVPGSYQVAPASVAASSVTGAAGASPVLAGQNTSVPTTSAASATTIGRIDLPASSINKPVPSVTGPVSAPSAVPTRMAALASSVQSTRPAARAAVEASPAEPKPVRLATSGKATSRSQTAKSEASTKPETKPLAGTKAKADAKTADAKAKTDAKTKADAKKPDEAKAKADAKTKTDAKGGKADAKDIKGGESRTADKNKSDAKTDAAKSKGGERYWVQVASGSNKANLDKAWSNVKAKAPTLLNGRSTYTAPWRASNRLLIGPFKSEDEAQAEVNKLAKAGVGGIQFTSRAGADVDKVTAR